MRPATFAWRERIGRIEPIPSMGSGGGCVDTALLSRPREAAAAARKAARGQAMRAGGRLPAARWRGVLGAYFAA